MDVRKTIIDRMKILGWTRYRLAAEVVNKGISPATVYDYLRGTSEITSKRLGHILDVLELRIVATESRTLKVKSKRGTDGSRRKQT